MKLDSTDVRILEILQSDARITTKALADQLNLSTTPVFERVKRLERRGYQAVRSASGWQEVRFNADRLYFHFPYQT